MTTEVTAVAVPTSEVDKPREYTLEADFHGYVLGVNIPKDASDAPVLVFVDEESEEAEGTKYELFLNGMSHANAIRKLGTGTTFLADLMICTEPETWVKTDSTTKTSQHVIGSYRTYLPLETSLKSLKSAVAAGFVFNNFKQ